MEPNIDRSFLNRILGKKTKITLSYGSFQGILQHVDPSRTILLSDVELMDEAEQSAMEETASAPTSKDLSAEKLEMDGSNIVGCSVEEPASSSQKTWTCPTSAFKRDLEEAEDVQYIVIDGFQHNFGPVIHHIKCQNVIGIAAEGLNLCRNGKLLWLQIATRKHVYLFDILVLGARAFRNGLQTLLEDKNILKVIHDCRWLSDCLSHQYGIVLSNVFDTQIADVLLFSMGTGGFLPHCISTLEESLIRYLEMSPGKVSFLKHRQCAVQEDPSEWLVRPVPPLLLKVLALKVVYLLPLRLVMLDEMMSDFVALVDGYLDGCRQNPPALLGSMEFSSMELPEELLHLSALQEMRREKAVKEFKMNERGLLIRSHNLGQEEAQDHLDSQERMHATNLHNHGWVSNNLNFEGEKLAKKSVVLQERLFLEHGVWVSRKCKEDEAASSTKGQAQKVSAQVDFSIQEQMQKMRVRDNDEAKEQSTVSGAIPLVVRSSLGGSVQALKKPMFSALPSYPGILQGGSLGSFHLFRPPRVEGPAIRFGQPLQLGIRMPAPV
ncbi:piRNA biogenesis protein EXD1 isoform X2 [Microcaecilia unicolor]|uniref:PiRNA biogenesis protein EXD1 isoform X2 n=1 Tax=Microcaecilia unicolor TaxID=1415580 RepID=A0A6P7Z0V7_9AMPH|nr:piRNA biogenesis protein EXD1 isoform X2 [Microcaecilia unicolor]